MPCLECNQHLPNEVYNYSVNHYGIPLCIFHQRWIDDISRYTTRETIVLYFALKVRGVPAEIEKYDGHKHIDIAVTKAKVNIEVDGQHHNFSHRQALADLKRTFHSFQKGFLTLRIPNSLVRNNLEETADYITSFLLKNRDNHKPKYY